MRYRAGPKVLNNCVTGYRVVRNSSWFKVSLSGSFTSMDVVETPLKHTGQQAKRGSASILKLEHHFHVLNLVGG
jgi:hypothetical protein